MPTTPEEREYLAIVQGEIDAAIEYLDRFTGDWIQLGADSTQK